MSSDEEWVKTAMTDDTMVVEFLLRIKQSQNLPPPPPPPSPPVKQLKWSVRQRRSRPSVVKPTPRASPTTPLSWSCGATSVSGGSGGREDESSHSPLPSKLEHQKRSKANNNGEKSVIKRSRRKKTLTELKAEEELLLKERKELKRELSALRVNLEKQRTTSERLKRMKIELQPRFDQGTSIASCLPKPPITPSVAVSNNIVGLQFPAADDSPKPEAKVMLPDLNLAFEEANNNGEKSVIKRSRRKKTLTELKAEEELLLKERKELKRELSALRVNLEKQRTTSERLKRMKIELQPRFDQGTSIASCLPKPPITPSVAVSNNIVGLQFPAADDSPKPEAKVMLPDLNLAFEEVS